MARTAAKRAQPRVGGRGRRRLLVDSRQMELSFAAAPEPVNTLLPELRRAPKSYPTDLFESCSVDVHSVKAPVPCKAEAPPLAANDAIDSEAQTLVTIVDLLIEMWREASGEDLRPSILGSQSL
jgi:hypothetical protein